MWFKSVRGIFEKVHTALARQKRYDSRKQAAQTKVISPACEIASGNVRIKSTIEAAKM